MVCRGGCCWFLFAIECVKKRKPPIPYQDDCTFNTKLENLNHLRRSSNWSKHGENVVIFRPLFEYLISHRKASKQARGFREPKTTTLKSTPDSSKLLWDNKWLIVHRQVTTRGSITLTLSPPWSTIARGPTASKAPPPRRVPLSTWHIRAKTLVRGLRPGHLMTMGSWLSS